MNISIITESGQTYYWLFYQLSLIVSFLFFLGYGIRKGYPLFAWILIGFSGFLFFIIGSKLGAMSWDQLRDFLVTGNLNLLVGRTDIFGFLFGLMGIVLSKKLTDFKHPVLNVYAYTVPIGVFVQRFGCLYAGCCHGTVSNGPFTVHYASHYSIYQRQLAEGLISSESLMSIPVHPVPIYLMVGSIVTLILVSLNYRRFKRDGSLLLFSLISLFTFRFIIEFVRDSSTNHFMGDTFFSLKLIQWTLILSVVVFIIFLTRLNRSGEVIQEKVGYIGRWLMMRNLALFLMLISLITVSRPLFTQIDIVAFNVRLVISLLTLVVLYRRIILQSPRLVGFFLILGGALWMGQANLNQENSSADTSLISNREIKDIKSWIRGSFVFGSPEGNRRVYEENGCDQVLVQDEEYQGKYAGGLWYEQTSLRKSGKEFLFGGGVNFAQYKVLDKMRPASGSETSFSLGSYLGRANTNYGYRIGGYLGALQWINPSSGEVEQTVFYPMLGLRIGNLQKLYGRFGFVDDLKQGMFGSYYRFIAGANLARLDSPNDLRFEIGAVRPFGQTNMQLYLGGYYVISDQIVIEPLLQIGDHWYYGMSIGMRLM